MCEPSISKLGATGCEAHRVCESLSPIEWEALGSISGVMVAAEHIPNKAGASHRRWRREYILR